MSTSIDICNTALTRLGAKSIASLSDGSRESDLCSARYPLARKAVLRKHPWSGATARAQLNPSTTTPSFEYEYQFELPADCLRVLQVSSQPDHPYTDVDYKIEGRNLLYNYAAVYLGYVKDTEDAFVYNELLSDAVAYYLARDIARSINGDEGDLQLLAREYREKLAEARAVDSKENYPKQLIAVDWINDSREQLFSPISRFPGLQ